MLIDGAGLDPLDEIWRQISNMPPGSTCPEGRQTPRARDPADQRIHRAGALLARIASGHYSTRDFSADSLRQALELYVLHFPVYRTYLTRPARPRMTAH